MNKSQVILFGNAEVPSNALAIQAIDNADKIICIDGGVDNLIKLGYEPSYILGDLDSLAFNPEYYKCEFEILEDQSKSDLEKALEWCAKNKIKSVILVGFSGLRDDHNLAVLLLLKMFSSKISITLITNFCTIYCNNGKARFNVSPGQIISIIASEPKTLISTYGLKYKLNNAILASPGHGISNIAINNSIEIESNDWIWLFLKHNK